MSSGGKREGAGRPAGSLNKTKKDPAMAKTGRIVISCTKSQEAELKEHAKAAGMTVSAYLLSLAFK